MDKPKQQLIIIFEANDLTAVEQIVNANAEDGPRYKSPVGQMPVIFSVKASTVEIFEALILSKADFIITPIGMDMDDVYSAGEISQTLFFDLHKKKKQKPPIDYEAELKKAIAKEDYQEAAIIRDIIGKVKTGKDLEAYRKRLTVRKENL